MKKIYIGFALLFCLASIVFTVLPMGTIAFLPIALSIVFGFLALRNSDGRLLHASRLILFVSGSMLLIVVGKQIFIKDEIAADKQFEAKKAESEKETAKELEELEGLE